MQGFYGSPRHGGNKDYASYRMLGLDYPNIIGQNRYGVARGSYRFTQESHGTSPCQRGHRRRRRRGRHRRQGTGGAGLSVVLLERGQWPRYDQNNDDELVSQRTPALGNPFGPDDARYRRVIANADGTTRIVLPSEGGYNNNAGCVGGGTASYGAMAWRFMRQDFRLKFTYGDVKARPSTTGPSVTRTWSLSTRRPSTRSASAATTRSTPSPRRGKKPYPMPAFPYNKEGQIMVEATKRLGLHPFPIPMLRNSVPYNGRPACIHMRSCVGFACPVNAKAGSHNTVIPIALATGNCEVRTGCVAAEISSMIAAVRGPCGISMPITSRKSSRPILSSPRPRPRKRRDCC